MISGPTTKAGRPRLCFVGPMVGRNLGHITTQGEILSDKFAEADYSVISVSTHVNRYKRFADIVSTLIRRRHHIDILIIQVYSELSFIIEDVASWIGKSLGKPIIMVLRGGTIPDFASRFPKWTRRVLGRADVLVAPSSFLAGAVTQYGFPVRVIPNIVDLLRYPFRLRTRIRPRLFWMRSFYSYYNPAMALRVLARLRLLFPDATLVMAGRNKGLEGEMKRLAEERGLKDAVRFPGFLDLTGKQREGSAADVYINTNHIDNMPVAVLEACAMGLPVVTTNVGGIPDLLIDGETGLFVSDNDDEAMATAIVRLVQQPELAARLSANGRKLAERLSWENVRQQWETLMATLTTRDRFESDVA